MTPARSTPSRGSGSVRIAAWSVRMAARPGLKAVDMFRAVEEGRITGYALTAGQAVGTGGELCFFTCHESHSPCWLLPMVSGVVTSLSTKP